jgi:hypothetical protein
MRDGFLGALLGIDKTVGYRWIAVRVDVVGAFRGVEIKPPGHRVRPDHFGDAVLHGETPVPGGVIGVLDLEGLDGRFQDEHLAPVHSLRFDAGSLVVSDTEAVEVDPVSVIAINLEVDRLGFRSHPDCGRNLYG